MTDIKIDEVICILKGLEIAINKKVFTKAELDSFFPAWNNVTSTIEKMKRQAFVDQLYRESVIENNID